MQDTVPLSCVCGKRSADFNGNYFRRNTVSLIWRAQAVIIARCPEGESDSCSRRVSVIPLR